jgi:hypothetical protein
VHAYSVVVQVFSLTRLVASGWGEEKPDFAVMSSSIRIGIMAGY